jgi:hypothetical protein
LLLSKVRRSVISEEIPQSHIKLAATATGGADAEHSPYYRRLLSSGYKGFIQGTIGGSTLYGGFGAIIGSVVAFTALASGAGLAALFAIPVFAGLGLLKGANTFGTIGATAAIFAEGAEMSERRGALLDRLHVTQSQQEADEIIKALHEDTKEKPLKKLFHWKALLIGATIGAVVFSLASFAVPHLLSGILGTTIMSASQIAAATDLSWAQQFVNAIARNPWVTGLVSAVIGAVGGATIGIDRQYIRRWFDLSENIVYDASESLQRTRERQIEAGRLSSIAEVEGKESDAKTKPIEVAEQTTTPKPNPMPLSRSKEDNASPKVKVQTAGLERAALEYPALRAPVV